MLKPEVFEKIYRRLDEVSPLSCDCGKECGAVCCSRKAFDDGSEPYIYLLPGEKEYLESRTSCLEIKRELRAEHDFPESYGEYVYVLYCREAGACDRRFRPIQCRTFPLMPYITDEGELLLGFYDGELPYNCPLIEDNRELQEDFIKATYEAWEMLLEDDAIRDLIKLK